MSQSSESWTCGTSTQPDLPLAIKSNLSFSNLSKSNVSYDNATWHTVFCKQDASATSCKLLQTPYLKPCLNVQFQHTNTYEYIWIDFIYIVYVIKRQSIVYNTI